MADNSNIINVFIPCQMDIFQSGTAASTFTVLQRLGLFCQYYDEQTCCGKRFYMQGEIEYAQNMGIHLIRNLKNPEEIGNPNVDLPFIIPDTACAGFIKQYYKKLLENSQPPQTLKAFISHIYEICDYIVNIKKVETLGNIFNHSVFYIKICSALNLYPANDAPEILLRNTRGLDLLTDDNIHGCCGANGRFSAVNPVVAEAMTGEIINQIYNMGAEYITSTDIHCLQMMDAYKEAHNVGIEIIHIVDILKGEDEE